MTIFRVPAPDGSIIRVNAPDRATAVYGAQQIYASRSAKPAATGPTTADLVKGNPGVAVARRSLDQQVDGDEKPGSVEGVRQFLRQYTMGGSDALLAGAYAAAQGGKNLVGGLFGQKPGESAAQAYDDMRAAEIQRTAQYESPGNTTAGVVGGLATPAGLAGDFIKGAKVVAKSAPLTAKALGLFGKLGRAGVVGGATGAVAGATNAPTVATIPSHAAVGGALGVASAPAVVASGAAGAKIGDAAGKVVAPMIQGGKRLVNAAVRGGAPVPAADLTRVAAQRLSQAIEADGGTTADLRAIHNHALSNGVTDSSLADLVAKFPNGGQNTLRFIKNVAANGPAAAVAQSYADETAANLQGKAIDRTMALTPDDTRPAPVAEAQALEARKVAAEADYPPTYQTPVDARPVVPSLEGDAGRLALNKAAARESANGRDDGVADVEALRQAAFPRAPAPPDADAIFNGDPVPEARPAVDPNAPVATNVGALDKVRRAYNFLGSDEKDPDIAAGFHARAEAIDEYLASQSDPFAKAKDNFARASAAIDALATGKGALAAKPDQYSVDLGNLNDKATDAAAATIPSAVPDMAALGHRQALTDAIGAAKAGALGPIDAVSGANAGRNLTTSFGPDAADSYQTAMADLAAQARTARAIKPSLAGADDVDAAATTPNLSAHGILRAALDKINAGVTLTDAERETIAKLGLDRADAPGVLTTLDGVARPTLPAPPRVQLQLPAPSVLTADALAQAQ